MTKPGLVQRILISFACLLLAYHAEAGQVIRAEVQPGATAVLQDGRQIFLECRPPRGQGAETFLNPLLAEPESAKIYRNRQAFAIRFGALNAETRRQVLLALFKEDYVDAQGWWHMVVCAGSAGQETLWSLCEWTTGKGTNYRKVMDDPRNRQTGPAPEAGQKVIIPAALLLDVMKRPTPGKRKAVSNGDDEPIDLESVTQELIYGEDKQGKYAAYRIRKGEALYSAVVVRFTDYSENSDILQACEVIRRRSGIKDVHDIDAGHRILIPIEMVSDRYRPKGSQQRAEYEASIAEAKRLRSEQVRTRDLEGVVVILDPGHGGRDHGAKNVSAGLYEDEINYDIVCRVKALLESTTRAKVYVTLEDPSQGYATSESRRFAHDTDERLLTKPKYPNEDAKVSANLRWYLANSCYRAEVNKGTDARKIVFTSFHTDALYNSSLRGAMIYIPGAAYCDGREDMNGTVYAKYAPEREYRHANVSSIERRRNEALSRNLANDVMVSLGRHQVRRHLEGDWIRNKICQSGGKVYVPAVLRGTIVPTKVLIEVANMTNDTDCQRLADPQWRQMFAEAYVDALKMYFGS